jgi:ATP-binding cassette subfamily B protein
MAQGGVFPLMAKLDNGNMIIVVGVKPARTAPKSRPPC